MSIPTKLTVTSPIKVAVYEIGENWRLQELPNGQLTIERRTEEGGWVTKLLLD